jgi:prepilin-type N-terminal cleavage/methylation domain-containing protein
MTGPERLQWVTGHRHRRARLGFTIVEVLVSLAIMVMIAAVVTPSLLGYLDRTRVDQGLSSVEALAAGVVAFRNSVGRYPGFFTQLTTPISKSDRDSCESTFNNAHVNSWAANGPFVNRLLSPGGIPISIGTAQDALVRESIGGNQATLSMFVDGVRLEDAREIDRRLDGDGSSTTGAVRWTPANAAVVQLELLQVIAGC